MWTGNRVLLALFLEQFPAVTSEILIKRTETLNFVPRLSTCKRNRVSMNLYFAGVFRYLFSVTCSYVYVETKGQNTEISVFVTCKLGLSHEKSVILATLGTATITSQ